MHGSCLSWTFSLSAPHDCIHRLLHCQFQIFMFCSDKCHSISLVFWKRKLHQKICSMNVCSPEGILLQRDMNTLKSISELSALVWVLEKRHNSVQMCFKAGSFIFLLKMYSMDVLCKSKVVHFNTTMCQHFFHLLISWFTVVIFLSGANAKQQSK